MQEKKLKGGGRAGCRVPKIDFVEANYAGNTLAPPEKKWGRSGRPVPVGPMGGKPGRLEGRRRTKPETPIYDVLELLKKRRGGGRKTLTFIRGVKYSTWEGPLHHFLHSVDGGA